MLGVRSALSIVGSRSEGGKMKCEACAAEIGMCKCCGGPITLWNSLDGQHLVGYCAIWLKTRIVELDGRVEALASRLSVMEKGVRDHYGSGK
jgi:hypothetical protein